jgi:hypothetical protein
MSSASPKMKAKQPKKEKNGASDTKVGSMPQFQKSLYSRAKKVEVQEDDGTWRLIDLYQRKGSNEVVLHFGKTEFEGIDGDYTIDGFGVLHDPDGDVIQSREPENEEWEDDVEEPKPKVRKTKTSSKSTTSRKVAGETAPKKRKQKNEDVEFKGVVADALKKAEAKAKSMTAVAKPTMEQITDCLLLLGKNWPTQSRPNVTPNGQPVTGFSMGLVYGLGGYGMKVSKISEHFPELTKLLTRFITASIPDKSFTYSSLQINFNYAARRHVDGNNLGPSYILSLGDHTGGELWTAGQGIIDCHNVWKQFMGTEEHETKPFKGSSRISLIPFTHNAFEELKPELCDRLKGLGFMAVGSSRIRDAGEVDEESFDEYWARRKREAGAELTDLNRQSAEKGGALLAVDCAGWACGRGCSWVAFRSAGGSGVSDAGGSGGKKSASKEAEGQKGKRKRKSAKDLISKVGEMDIIETPKNSTGFHVLELALETTKSSAGVAAASGFRKVQQIRFPLYSDIHGATQKFVDFVDALEPGRIVTITTSDSAIAKSRPLGDEIYTALKKLGCPEDWSTDPAIIGYRNPFAFVGVKGAPAGSATFSLDKHAQSKTIVRAQCTAIAGTAKGTTTELHDMQETRTLLTDILGKPKICGYNPGGRPIFSKEAVKAAQLEAEAAAKRAGSGSN